MIWFCVPVKEANTEPTVPTYLPCHHTHTLIVLHSIALSLTNLISENKCNTIPIVCSWILHFLRFCAHYVYSPGQMPIRKMFPRFYIILFGPHKNMKLGFYFIHCLWYIFHSHQWSMQAWTGPKAPTFPENQHMKLVGLSALCTHRLEPPVNNPHTHVC